jgi:NTE family protein
MMDQIKASVSRRVTEQELEDRREAFALKKPVMDIDSIGIEGLSTSQQEYVNRLLIRPGGDLPLENLKSEYFKLLADDKIKYVFPTLYYDAASDHTTLCLKITRSEQFEAEFGGNIASNASTTGFVGLRYHLFDKVGYTVSGNGYFGRFYSSAKIETRLDVASRFPFFISAEFTYNHKDYFKNSTYFFEDKQPTFLLQNESHGGIVVGIPASAKGRIQGGVYTGYTKDNYYQTNQFTREDTTDRSYFDFWAPQISFELNNLDKKQYASAGSRLLISLKYITGKEKTIAGSTSLRTGEEFIDYHHWIQFRLVYDNYFQNFKFLKLGFYGDILLSNQPVFSNYTETILRTPAFEPLPDMKSLFLANYRSTNYAALGLKALFPIYRRVGFRLEGYLYQPYEELTRDEVTGEAVMQKAFSYRSAVANGVLVYDSPIGPISLSAMYLDRDEQSWYFLFNIGYVIFNRSALE